MDETSPKLPFNYSSYEEPTARFKALRRLVREHDLRLREAEIHIQKELTYVPLEKFCNEESEAFFKYGEELLEEMEATVLDFCTEVEKGREKLQQQKKLVIDDINQYMERFLKMVVEILNIDATLSEVKERLRQQHLNQSQQQLERDDIFRVLFEERQKLVDEQKRCLQNLKALDLNKVVTGKKKLHQLSEEKKKMNQQVRKEWLRIVQELLRVPRIDRETADLIQFLSKSIEMYTAAKAPETLCNLSEDTEPLQNSIHRTSDAVSRIWNRDSIKHRSSIVMANEVYGDKLYQYGIPNLFTKNNRIYPLVETQANHLDQDVYSAVVDIVAFRKRDFCLTQKMKQFLSSPQLLQQAKPETAFFSWTSTYGDTQDVQSEMALRAVLAETLIKRDEAVPLSEAALLHQEPYFKTLLSPFFTHSECEAENSSASSTVPCKDSKPSESIVTISLENRKNFPQRRPPPHQIF